MKHAGRQRRIDARGSEDVDKVFGRTGAAGCDQGNLTAFAHRAQLRNIIPAAHAVARHAIEHYFPRTAPLHFLHPLQGIAPSIARTRDIAGELLHAVAAIDRLAIDTDDDTLCAKSPAQCIDQVGFLERRRVDGDFFGTGCQNCFSIRQRANSARNAKWDIQRSRHAGDPGSIHRAAFGARGDIVEHQFIGAVIAITRGELQNIADNAMIAELYAFDDLTVAYVKTGNQAFGKNGCNSSMGIRFSSKALPLMAAAAPASDKACKSWALRMPPEACHSICG